jgi:hypothetical protein
MDEARAVLERLERIERLERGGAPPAKLLPELRELVRLLLLAELRRARRRPELDRAAPLEHDEELLLGGVRVRDRDLGVRAALRPLDPRRVGARRFGEHAVAVLVELDVLERDDVRRSLARLRELDVALACLDVPRVVGASLGPRVAEAHRARARQPAVLGRMARAEDEVVEPVRSGAERVLVVVRDLDDRVPRPDFEGCLVLPRETRAAEDEVDLL